LGDFTHAADVGQPALAGSTTYDPERKTYTLRASGTNMWSTHDEFHAVWRALRGDFVLRTRARFTSEGGEPHRKLGWIVRASLDDNAAYADAVVSGNGMVSLQFRRAAGAQTELIASPAKAPDMIRFERRGRKFIMSVARFGEPFTHTELADIDLGDAVYVGLFLCAHDPTALVTATFDEVRIDAAPFTGLNPASISQDEYGQKKENRND
ncbi:MAG: biopolymer transporter TolR, partial [Candidatus Accumulibacter sp.]|nr:biopolymer transporter TolR [Accumulibacter sp.]